MSLLSSVTGTATTIAAGLDSVTAGSNRPAGLISGVISGFTAARKPDRLTSGLLAKPGAKSASGSAGKATAKGAPRAATGTAKKSAAPAGYGTSVAEDFAFLKDPKLSVEEKLFRFMCAIAKRNDDEVLKKMEEMKGGAASSASKSSSSGTAKKSKGTSVWGALKALVPPLGLAAQVVGDAKLKSLVTQVSGPVLAAAATALGLPMLAPLAMKAGPGLATELLNARVGGDGETATGKDGGSSTGGSSSATSSTGKNEQVQMMELQRLVDKQKEMFAMISNVLRAQHDTRMSIIGNVR